MSSKYGGGKKLQGFKEICIPRVSQEVCEVLSTFEESKEFVFAPQVSKDNNHDEVWSLGQTYLDVIWDVESENITQQNLKT